LTVVLGVTRMDRPVGIDDLNVYGSTHSIDIETVARARGRSAKGLQAVQFLRRSVTPPSEDAVTLAVNAARPVVDAAGADTFTLLIVATESGLDYGKPLSTYVHHLLGLSPACRNFEVKYACHGGTTGIQLAVSWIRSHAAPGAKALVVMTDLARQHLGDPAELSAGSGAVAAVIAADPAVLCIERASGYACREVYDVARPTTTGEWGDAVLSLAAYLDLLEMAWQGYREQSGSDAPVDERFRYMLYHTPLVSLVWQAHESLLFAGRDDLSPSEVNESFDRMVAPALGYPRELANIYSGSVYSKLASLVDQASELAPGTRIGIFSYGSGSCAELFGGVVAEGARQRLARHRIGARLARRWTLDVPEYERFVRETDIMLTSRDYEPPFDAEPERDGGSHDREPRLVLSRIRNYHREYAWTA
jgi:3-hydroxy-3-methylglutaryl CoA synthase